MGSQMNTRKKLNSGAYIEGTAVRKLSQYEQAVPEEMPGRHHAPEKRQQTPKRKTSQSRPKILPIKRGLNSALPVLRLTQTPAA